MRIFALMSALHLRYGELVRAEFYLNEMMERLLSLGSDLKC